MMDEVVLDGSNVFCKSCLKRSREPTLTTFSHSPSPSISNLAVVTQFERITQLEQYVFLLRCALKRLCGLLGVKVDSWTNDAEVISEQMRRMSLREGDLFEEPKIGGSKIRRSRAKTYSGAIGGRKGASSRHGSGGDRSLSTGDMTGDASGEETEGRLKRSESLQIQRRAQSLSVEKQEGLKVSSIPASPTEHSTRSDARVSFSSQDSVSLTTNLVPASSSCSPHIQQSSSNTRYLSELSALEHFIVRQIAAISVHPLLEEFFTLDQLMGIIDMRKATIWNKFLAGFKGKKQKIKGTLPSFYRYNCGYTNLWPLLLPIFQKAYSVYPLIFWWTATASTPTSAPAQVKSGSRSLSTNAFATSPNPTSTQRESFGKMETSAG